MWGIVKGKSILRKIRPLVSMYNCLRHVRLSAGFLADYRAFRRLASRDNPRFEFRWQDRYPCLYDRTANTGFDRHYIYHPAWAARILAKRRSEFHVDISSTLHFCTLVSAFLPVRFFDYRPADIRLDNLVSEHADICALPFTDGSVPSLSCMHVAEHVGLGRYGDPLDPEGDLRAMSELKRVLAAGGDLLFVVPVGRPRIMFNAHRIYSYEQILGYFSGLELKEFSLVPDNPLDGGLIQNATRETADAQTYGCGCFWFRKKA
jgi:SAM-dependent methyltransferase